MNTANLEFKGSYLRLIVSECIFTIDYF